MQAKQHYTYNVKMNCWAVVAHVFNPSTGEAEDFYEFELVPGEPRLHKETLSQGGGGKRERTMSVNYKVI